MGDPSVNLVLGHTHEPTPMKKTGAIIVYGTLFACHASGAWNFGYRATLVVCGTFGTGLF